MPEPNEEVDEETLEDDAFFLTAIMQPSNPWPGIPEAEDDE